MAIFATVVETGSMRAASQQLGMTPSAVSQHIRAFEAQLGVALLHRSTRKLTLTGPGQVFFPGCQAMLREAKLAEQRLAESRDMLSGELRIAATVGIGGLPLANALAPLLQKHPGLLLRVLAADESVDLINERVDIALRLSHGLPDSSFIAHPLSEWPMVVCAAPHYLTGHGVPSSPQDLFQHQWILYGEGDHYNHIDLHNETGGEVTLRITGQVVSHNMSVVRAFTLAGMGVSLQPLLEITDLLKGGELMQLLPAWQTVPLQMVALTQQRAVSAKVRQAIECLQTYFSRTAQL